MGSIAAMSKREMSPARARLLQAAKAARYGLKELSQMLGRNPSYLQQYVAKHSPRALPEDIRHQLAAILHVGEEQLRDAAETPAAAPPLPIAAAAHRTAPPPAAGRLPLVSEDATGPEAIAAASAFLTPSDLAAEAEIAIRLMRPHGMLQPRHIVVCDSAPPRLGDLAYVAVPDESPAIGLLLPSQHGRIGVLEGSVERHLPAEAARVFRIVAVRTA